MGTKEDLQSFRRHPRIWEDDSDFGKTQEGGGREKDDSDKDCTTERRSNPSWPLTSFDNTIQNVCCISFLMGFLFCAHLSSIILYWNSVWTRLNVYALLLISFHLLEFLTTAIFNPTRVTVDSFLLNNGMSYWYAQGLSITEYIIREVYLTRAGGGKNVFFEEGPNDAYNNIKSSIKMIGIMMILMGQIVRTLAMITAANSFNHRVSTHVKKLNDHSLVTFGVYKIARHPSYFGFFWWSLGIQFFLFNFVSAVVFTVVLWRFFNSRIIHEEFHLVKFFKQDYLNYKASTPTYIPFIK